MWTFVAFFFLFFFFDNFFAGDYAFPTEDMSDEKLVESV